MFISSSKVVERPAFFVATPLEMPVSTVEGGASFCDAALVCRGPSWLALSTHANQLHLLVRKCHLLPLPRLAIIQHPSSHVSGAVLGAGDTGESTVVLRSSRW